MHKCCCGGVRAWIHTAGIWVKEKCGKDFENALTWSHSTNLNVLLIQVDNILDEAVGEVEVPLLALFGPAEEKAWSNLFTNGIEVVNARPNRLIVLKVVVGGLLEPLPSLLLWWLWGLRQSVSSVANGKCGNLIFNLFTTGWIFDWFCSQWEYSKHVQWTSQSNFCLSYPIHAGTYICIKPLLLAW